MAVGVAQGVPVKARIRPGVEHQDILPGRIFGEGIMRRPVQTVLLLGHHDRQGDFSHEAVSSGSLPAFSVSMPMAYRSSVALAE